MKSNKVMEIVERAENAEKEVERLEAVAKNQKREIERLEIAMDREDNKHKMEIEDIQHKTRLLKEKDTQWIEAEKERMQAEQEKYKAQLHSQFWHRVVEQVTQIVEQIHAIYQPRDKEDMNKWREAVLKTLSEAKAKK